MKHRLGVTPNLCMTLAVMATLIAGWVAPAQASSEFQQLSGQLSSQNQKAAEVSAHINDIDGQLAVIERRVADTKSQIAETNGAIADAKQRMAGHQVRLAALMQREYQKNQESKIEMLASSKNFSDYVERDMYLKANQDQIAASVEEIIRAKKEMEAKAAELAKLNVDLDSAQQGLNFARAQQAGELAAIEAARADLQAKLAKYGGQVVYVGQYVNAGDLIGFEGTSGCSTGPHLHFEVQRAGSPVNPRSAIGQLRWPFEGGYSINQEFGSPNWAAPYSFHSGMDLSQHFGAPVYAAAAGTVSFAGYDRSGFGDHVIINHGGGLSTIYGHLGARASDYPNC
jgi:septal ring factor EnvC (AmiA/AmiB activator)